MPSAVRALRGAITVEVDTAPAITEAVETLIGEMLGRNDVAKPDLISIIFTATADLRATFPATPARLMGLGDIPLLSAGELEVQGATPRCIRVLMHLNTERTPAQLRHVYLRGAAGLNDDLPV